MIPVLPILPLMLLNLKQGVEDNDPDSDNVQCVEGIATGYGCISGLTEAVDAADALYQVPAYCGIDDVPNQCYSLTRGVDPEGTPAAVGSGAQVGALQYDFQVSPTNSLEVTGYIYLGDKRNAAPPLPPSDPGTRHLCHDCDGFGEGMAFIITKEPIEPDADCAGSGLGYIGCFDEFVAVEFDTRRANHPDVGDDWPDIKRDHVNIRKKSLSDPADGVSLGEYNLPNSPHYAAHLDNNLWRYIRIKYDEPKKELKVFMVHELVDPLVSDVSAPIDLMEVFDLPTNADEQLYFGFVAATSDRQCNDQAICIPTGK